jgi:hypothetical protein
MIALLLLQSAPLFVPVAGLEPLPTPSSLTEPIHHFDCIMIGEDGATAKVVARREGRQGYLDVTTSPDKPFAARTKTTFRILEDGTGLLSKMQSVERQSSRWANYTLQDPNGNTAVFNSDLWPDDETNKAVLSLYYYPNGSDEPKAFAGPCKMNRIAQMPLDRDPKEGSK